MPRKSFFAQFVVGFSPKKCCYSTGVGPRSWTERSLREIDGMSCTGDYIICSLQAISKAHHLKMPGGERWSACVISFSQHTNDFAKHKSS